MVKKIANVVFNKLFSSPSNGFGDFVGIEAHIKTMDTILRLESEEVRMVGIWGQSGIGKSTLGRALFSHLSPKFSLHAFLTYKSTDQDIVGTKLLWEKQLLVEIFKRNIEVDRLGMVEQMLKDKKVLIVLDDVASEEFLKTLVGKPEWFGPGSRIIVISQDSHLLKVNKIEPLYEVKIPNEDIGLKMLCQSAFGENSPHEGYKELAVEVAKVAGNLPLGLRVLGSSLKGRTTKEWKELLPGLQKGLKGDIMKTLRIGYDRLEEKEKEIFLWIACLFNGKSVKSINDFFGDNKGEIKRLAEKFLIRITLDKNLDWRRVAKLGTRIAEMHNLLEELDIKIVNDGIVVEMHDLLEKLGTEIVRAESRPGERRFLMDDEEVRDVLTNRTGTETVLGIYLGRHASINEKSINEKSLKGMFNLQFLEINNSNLNRWRLPNGLVYLRNLKYLEWNGCPLKCLPSNFKAEFLVELRMEFSKFEKLWQGTQQLGSLKTIRMQCSIYLKEIPDLSKAINLETVDFSYCENLESIPRHLLSWESIEYFDLFGCKRLKNFPEIKMESLPHGIEIKVNDWSWNKNVHGLDYLSYLRRCNPIKFLPEHIVHLRLFNTIPEKLWDGVQGLGNLWTMNLSYSENLKEIPDLSKATNLVELDLTYCISLLTLPSTIGNLQKLEKLVMEKCKGLKILPVDVNLSSLKTLNLIGCSSLTSFPRVSRSIEKLYLDDTAIEEVPCLIEMLPRLIEFSMCGCSKLTSFPQLSPSIGKLYLDDTAIEEVPCCIEMFRTLTKLSMCRCSKLKNISPNIFRLTSLKEVDFANCGGVITAMAATIEDPYETIEKGKKVDKEKNEGPWNLNFENCFKLDRDARELIIQSSFKSIVILPGGEVPPYFNHRASGNSLTVTLPQSSLCHQILRFNVCAVVEQLHSNFTRLYLKFRFNGVFHKHVVRADMWNRRHMWQTNHLVLFFFNLQSRGLPSKLDIDNVEFEFEALETHGIKEFGIRILDVSPSLDDRDGRSSEAKCNQQAISRCR